jgi:hypothetical protein
VSLWTGLAHRPSWYRHRQAPATGSVGASSLQLSSPFWAAEDLIKIALIRLMAARLAGQQTRYRNVRSAMA